jgi:DNA-binding beta-propeller fold protein YncE
VPAASPVELVWSSDGGAQRLVAPAALAVDHQGAVIVVDTGTARLVRLDAHTGKPLADWGSWDSATRPLQFILPSSYSQPDTGTLDPALLTGHNIAITPAGEIIVADGLNHRLQVMDAEGHLAGSMTFGDQTAGWPAGLAVGASGDWYVADRQHGRILKVDAAGTPLLTWGSPGAAVGEFSLPLAVAIDPMGRVVVLDSGNDRVQVFDSEGRFVATWGGLGHAPGELFQATALAIDAVGRVYVADGGNYRVQVFNAAGVVLAAWGEPGVGPGQFAAVSGIAVDDQGAIYVADSAAGRVQKFRPRAAWPVVAGTPTPRPAPSLGLPGPPPFMTPTDR